jgi:uncharacterized protein YbjT (DUF2867 family)
VRATCPIAHRTDLGYALTTGTLLGSAGDGEVSDASRADLAEAAAVALTSHGQGNAVYELGGTAFTMSDLAATISQLTGKPLVYKDMAVALYTQVLASAGLPASLAEVVADTSFAIQRGDWFTKSTDLAPRLPAASADLDGGGTSGARRRRAMGQPPNGRRSGACCTERTRQDRWDASRRDAKAAG